MACRYSPQVLNISYGDPQHQLWCNCSASHCDFNLTLAATGLRCCLAMPALYVGKTTDRERSLAMLVNACIANGQIHGRSMLLAHPQSITGPVF